MTERAFARLPRCAALAALLRSAPEEEWTVTPQPLGDGPLLLFAVPGEPERDTAADRATSCDGAAWHHLLCAPDDAPEPRVWLAGPRALAPRARLSRSRLLLAEEEGATPWRLADLAAGTLTVLPIGRNATLLEARGDELLIEEWIGDGAARVSLAPQSGAAPPRPLADLVYHERVDRHGDDLFVLVGDGRGTPAVVWELPLAGGAARAIAPLPARAMAGFVRVRCSPDGRRLAWSCTAHWVAGEEEMAHLEPAAAARYGVVERSNGKELLAGTVASIAVSPLSSQLPALEFTWVDDATLRLATTEFADASERSWYAPQLVLVDVDVATGREVARHRRSTVGLAHEPPPVELLPLGPTERRGWFEEDHGHLYFAGHPEPIAARFSADAIIVSDWRIAPDGGHALLRRQRDGAPELYLLHGVSRERRLVRRGPLGPVDWLPAAR